MSASIEVLKKKLMQKYTYDLTSFDVSFLDKYLSLQSVQKGELFVDTYLERLLADEAAASELFDTILITHSTFFRHPEQLQLLAQELLPGLLKQKNARDSEIRIWSAGCAMGQEAYTLAIVLEEEHHKYPEFKHRIFATDINTKALAKAEKGSYGKESIKHLPDNIIAKYFNHSGEYCHIKESLRKNIHFEIYDLLSATKVCPPSSIFGGFDLIVCCNVLFYYKHDVRKKIIKKLTDCLDQNGCIMVGDAERAFLSGFGLKEIIRNTGIFKLKI